MKSPKYIFILLFVAFCIKAGAQQWDINSLGGSSPEKIVISESPPGIWVFDKECGSFWLGWDNENGWGTWEDFDANYYWCMGGDAATIGETPYALSATMAANHLYQYSGGIWNYLGLPIDNAYYMYHDAQFFGDQNNAMSADRFIVSTWQVWHMGEEDDYKNGLFLLLNDDPLPDNATPITGTDGMTFGKIYRDIRDDSNDTLYTFYDEGFWRITVTGIGQEATASVSSDFNVQYYDITNVLAFYQSIDGSEYSHQYLLMKTSYNSGEPSLGVWNRKDGSDGFAATEWSLIWDNIEIENEEGQNLVKSGLSAYYDTNEECHHIYVFADSKGLVHYDTDSETATIMNSDGSDYLQFYNTHTIALTPWGGDNDQIVIGSVHGENHFAEVDLSGTPVIDNLYTENGFSTFGAEKLSGEPRYVYQEGETVYYATWGMGIFTGDFSDTDPEFSKIGMGNNDSAPQNHADFNFNWNCCVRSPFDTDELLFGAPLRQYYIGANRYNHIGIWSLDESNDELSSENSNCFVSFGPYTVIYLGADSDRDMVYVSCMGTENNPLDLSPNSELYGWDGSALTAEEDLIVSSDDEGYYRTNIEVAGFGIIEEAHAEFGPILPHPNPYFANPNNPTCAVFGIGMQFGDWGAYSETDPNWYCGGGLGYGYSVSGTWNYEEIFDIDHEGINDLSYFEHPCDMLAEYNSEYYSGFSEYKKMDLLIATRAWPTSHGSEDIWRYGGLFEVHYDGDNWVASDVTPYAGSYMGENFTYKIENTENFQHPACMSVAKYDLGATNIYYCTTSGEEGGTSDGHLGLIWYQIAADMRGLTKTGWNLYQGGRMPYLAGDDKYFMDDYVGLAPMEEKLVVGLNVFPQQYQIADITANTTWNGNIDIVGDITISDGATLTLGPLCQVQVLGEYALIIDDGHLKVQYPDSTRILFDSPDAVRWKGIVYKDISGTDVDTLKNIEVRNAEYGIYVDYDDSDSLRLRIENCLFDGNCIGIGVKNTDQIDIINCEVRNSVKEGSFNGDGIYLYNLSTTSGITHSIKHCEIHDNEGCGVRITTCGGNLVLYNNAIEDNLQQNSEGTTSWAGVYCYNSSPKLLFNQVSESLGYPLATFSSAAPYLCQGPDSTNEFTLDVAEADTHYAVVYADGGFPILNNARNNFSHGGTTTGLLIDDATETPAKHYARYNWWGSNSPDTDQFSPLDSTDYSNYLTSPASFPTGMPERGIYNAQDAVYELLCTSIEAYHNGNMEDAYEGFVEIVSDYPDYHEAVSMALPYLMNAGLNLSVSQDSIYNYLDGIFEYYGDNYVGKTARRIRNICSLKMGNYYDAISDYEEIISDPASLADSIFALIDINQAYLIMNGSGMPGIQSLPQASDFNPGTLENYMKRESELLALLNSGTVTGSDELLPTNFCLHQNYPNPFNPVTSIRYDLPELSNVKLEVYNVLGQRVMTLVDGLENSGFKKVEWDGKSASGIPISSGIYIYRLQVTGKESGKKFTNSKKMILMK